MCSVLTYRSKVARELGLDDEALEASNVRLTSTTMIRRPRSSRDCA
jgi:hypothetical protein